MASTPLPMHSLATQDLSLEIVASLRALLSAFEDIAQPFQVHAVARLAGLHLAWGWSPEIMHVIWSSNGAEHQMTRRSCDEDAVQVGTGTSMSTRYAHDSHLQPCKTGHKRNTNGQENVCHQSLVRWRVHPGCALHLGSDVDRLIVPQLWGLRFSTTQEASQLGMWLTFPAGYTPHDLAHMA